MLDLILRMTDTPNKKQNTGGHMKRKTYLLMNCGEVRKFSKTAYQKYLRAVKSDNVEKLRDAWYSGKLIGVLNADVTELTAEDADFKLQCLAEKN